MQISVSEFLQRHGRDLFRATEAKLPPLVQEPRLTWQGGRKPMGAQALAITGIAEALRRRGVGILAAEMGTGKTHMAIRAALELDPKGAFLVLCPPHLVEKWAREVREEGAHAVILRERQDLEALPHAPRPLFAVLSRERAKLGPGWEPAVAYRSALRKAVHLGEGGPKAEGRKVRVEVPVCPRCGHPVGRLPKTRRTACPKCREPLWQVRPPRREAMAHAIRRLLPKGFFRALILDEAHEYKGADSAQGLTAAGLISWVGKVLLLTGTLFGGYASSIYHLLARAVPGFREEFPTEASFVARYGLFKRVRRERVEGGYGRYTRRRETRTETYERPGISPLLLTHLVDKAAFVRLPEVAEALPPYGEEVVLLEMDEEHREAYEAFARGLSGVARRNLSKARRFLGTLIQAGLQVPDTPWQPEAVVDPETGNTVARFVPLSPDYRHAKERRLIALLAAEKLKGRRSIVYVQGTERRDQLARLAGILEAEGFRPIVLRADTARPEDREVWLKAQVEKGGDVLLCHPRVVQTGLDLVDFPTVVFYQPEYSVYTLRQAARRSWRIGQKEPVRVVYMAYRGTLQEAALVLIAQKARSSLALEGELVEGGLVSAAEEDPTVALAKALAGAVRLTWEGEGVGLEAAVHLGEGGPKAATGKAAGAAKAPTLPTLSEGRWVRTRRGRVFLPPGQPVLFAEVL
jgi:DNA-directed RNA polymerase subunit RPC12/RpoP